MIQDSTPENTYTLTEEGQEFVDLVESCISEMATVKN
jgi:hypothetical protein